MVLYLLARACQWLAAVPDGQDGQAMRSGEARTLACVSGSSDPAFVMELAARVASLPDIAGVWGTHVAGYQRAAARAMLCVLDYAISAGLDSGARSDDHEMRASTVSTALRSMLNDAAEAQEQCRP
jgi:hypothetical protein